MAGGSNVWEGAMAASGDDSIIVKGWLRVGIFRSRAMVWEGAKCLLSVAGFDGCLGLLHGMVVWDD